MSENPPELDAGPGRPATLVDDLCRLSIQGPGKSVELAVPVHVPLIDLLPALVGHLGDGLADAGLEHGGWVLQRLGDPPLREELSVAALGLRDGDVVHLRPRAEQLPPLDFDDLIDGIATGIAARPDRWRPQLSRRLLTGVLAAPLAAGLVVLAGHLGSLAVLIAAGLALVLIGLTAAAARGLGDLPVAAVLGSAAIGYAGLAAAELPLLPAGPGQVSALALRAVPLAAGAAMAGAAAAVLLAFGGRRPALTGAVVASLFVAAAGLLAAFARLGPAQVAGVLLALVMPVGGWVPLLAFRFTSMRLDPTPSTPDELQADLDPVPGQQVLDGTKLADRFMSALYGGLAVVVTGCLLALAAATGWPAHLVAIDAIALLTLHSRVLVAARHRLAVLIPALLGGTVLAAIAGLRAGEQSWPVILAALAVTAGLVLVAERSLPGRKLLPHWGRAGDLLHTGTAVALIPAVLWLLNLYQFARSGG